MVWRHGLGTGWRERGSYVATIALASLLALAS